MSVSSLATLSPDTIVRLIILDLFNLGIDQQDHFSNEVYPDGTLISRGGVEYIPIPFRITGDKIDAQGQLPTPQLEIADIYGNEAFQSLLTSYVERHEDLVGATITVLDVFAKWLDAGESPNPHAAIRSEIYTIERKASGSRLGYTFELSAGNNLQGAKIPKRQVTLTCSWLKYRGEGCAYAGTPIDDINGDPLIPTQVNNCTVANRTISKNSAGAFSAVSIGDAVVGAGIPFGAVVRFVADDLRSVQISKSATNGSDIKCWFAPESCKRNLLACKRRFGVPYQGVIIPGSDVIRSISSKRGSFDKVLNCFVYCNNLDAGMPVARKIIALLDSVGTHSITAFATVSGRWVFTTPDIAQLSPNSIAAIAGVHANVNGDYILALDSFTGVGNNQFAVTPKSIEIKTITSQYSSVTIETFDNHNLITGDSIQLKGTNGVDGSYTISSVPSVKIFTVSGSYPEYMPRGRDPFGSPEYMANFQVNTILNDAEANNNEGVVIFTTPKTSGSFILKYDRIQLDSPIESDAVSGTYNLTIGGENLSGYLNFGGQPGASAGVQY